MRRSNNRFLAQVLRFFLISVWLGLPSSFAADAANLKTADPGASKEWLDKLAHSMRELNYRGLMTYAHGSRLESLRITHGLHNDEEFERIEYLDGAPREIIRHGKEVTCIQLGQRLDFLLHPHLLKPSLEGLEQNYDVHLDGEDRIAGRRVVVLTIKPRDQFRYGYRMALDHDTGLLLRTEALDDEGRISERLQFVDVEIGVPLKKEWLADIGNGAAHPQKPATLPIDRVVEESQMQWRPEWVPPGFALSVAPHKSSEGLLTYSDGLAVMSVFVEAIQPPLPRSDGKARQGATIAYTHAVELNGKPHLVTVVGEIPPITARRVASSVVAQQQP
jgi:sigma-E factor negative regulatory protein RseB